MENKNQTKTKIKVNTKRLQYIWKHKPYFPHTQHIMYTVLYYIFYNVCIFICHNNKNMVELILNYDS